MQVFAKIIECSNCKNTLCLDADDVKWQWAPQIKDGQIISHAPNIVEYITTCISCKFLNKLDIKSLPFFVGNSAKYVKDGEKTNE